MQGGIPPRMSIPGQQPTLPPMQPGSMQPPPFGYGAPQALPSTIPSQMPMYGGPSPQLPMPMQAKAEPKALTYSGTKGNYKYTLLVEQQPQRARMCGFGDKDRRPITPPPCIRLVITDITTGKEVDHDDIDGSFFVLQVDLWDETASREVNIVRSSSASPAISISTATTTSYPPTERGQYYTEVQPGVYHTPEGIQVFGNPSGLGQPQLAYARSLIDPRAGLPSYAGSNYNPPAFHVQAGMPPQPGIETGDRREMQAIEHRNRAAQPVAAVEAVGHRQQDDRQQKKQIEDHRAPAT